MHKVNYLLPYNKCDLAKNRRCGCKLILQIRGVYGISLIFALDLTGFFFSNMIKHVSSTNISVILAKAEFLRSTFASFDSLVLHDHDH